MIDEEAGDLEGGPCWDLGEDNRRHEGGQVDNLGTNISERGTDTSEVDTPEGREAEGSRMVHLHIL